MASDYMTYLAVFKYASIAATAIFGVLGAAFETRNDGKLNKWGKMAIIGVVCSALLGTLTQSVELRVKRQEDAASARATQRVSEAQQESLQRLNDLVGSSTRMLEQLTATRTMSNTLIARSNSNLRIGRDIQVTSASNARSLQRSLGKLEHVATEQRLLVYQSYRQLTPLEPLAVGYRVEYPADAPQFKKYVTRLRDSGITYSSELSDDELPNDSIEGESLASELLRSAALKLAFLRGPGLFRLDYDLTLIPAARCTTDSRPSEECSDEAEEIMVGVDLDENVIWKRVFVPKMLNVSPAGYATVVSQVDLIGTELIVSVDQYAPVGTKLVELTLQSGGRSRKPTSIDFSAISANVYDDDDAQYIGLRSVTFSKTIQPSDLWLRLIPD